MRSFDPDGDMQMTKDAFHFVAGILKMHVDLQAYVIH